MTKAMSKRRILMIGGVLAVVAIAVGVVLLTRPAPPAWLPAFAQRIAQEHGDRQPKAAYYGYFPEWNSAASLDGISVPPYVIVLVGDFSRAKATLRSSADVGSVLFASVVAEDRLYTAWLVSQRADVQSLNEALDHRYRPLHALTLPGM